MEGWSTADVAAFVKQLGLGAYEAAMRDNDVTGAELAHADHAMLRQLGIDAVGHRIALLNAVHTKEADTLPATATAPFHAVSGTHGFSDELLIERMSGEILKLHNELAQLKSDLAPIWFLVDEYKSRGARADAKTPNTALYPPDLVKRTDSGPPASPGESNVGTIRICLDVIFNQDTSPDGLSGSGSTHKNFRVSDVDICSKILAGILKKYNVPENWKAFSLYIRFAGQERLLAYDERPLSLQNKIRDDAATPSFTIKRNADYVSGSSPINKSLPAAPTNVRSFVAVYKYRATRDDELDVNIGERFKVIKKDRDWFTVRRLDDRPGGGGGPTVGWVPCGCLKELDPNPDPKRQQPIVSSKRGVPADAELPANVIVLYDFDGTDMANALPVRSGDLLSILKKEENWLLAKMADRKGWVPDAYVALVSNGPESPGAGDGRTPTRSRFAGLLDRFDDAQAAAGMNGVSGGGAGGNASAEQAVILTTGKAVNFASLVETVNIGIGRWIEMEHRQESLLVGDKAVIVERLSIGLKWISDITSRVDSIRVNPKRDEVVAYIVNAGDAVRLCGTEKRVDEDMQLELVFSALQSAVKLL